LDGLAFADAAIEINRIFDNRIIELKKNLSSDEFYQRLEELEFLRNEINNLLVDYT
jgi:hypothetical protein